MKIYNKMLSNKNIYLESVYIKSDQPSLYNQKVWLVSFPCCPIFCHKLSSFNMCIFIALENVRNYELFFFRNCFLFKNIFCVLLIHHILFLVLMISKEQTQLILVWHKVNEHRNMFHQSCKRKGPVCLKINIRDLRFYSGSNNDHCSQTWKYTTVSANKYADASIR